MMISKEQLLSIHNLELSGVIDKMDGAQYDEYCTTLDGFIESFPVQELKLKSQLEAKDLDSFSKTLLTVLDMLTKIHANNLAQSCLKILSGVRGQNHETVEGYLTDFLAEISALSIDIQMAQHKNATTDEAVTKSRPAEPAEDQAAEEPVQKTILAVDDVSFLLNGLKMILHNSEYKFTGVTSGEAALRFIKKHVPDLFILDIEMPEMNGYELAQKIREFGQTAPIIFLTGNSSREHVIKAVQAGGADFIVKPINKENVLEKIRNQIG